MTRILTVSLITLGDPDRLTGGYLYHRRMAELAARFDVCVHFVSFPDLPFPLPLAAGAAVLRDVRRSGADAVLLDSIAAAHVAPWIAVLRGGPPLLAVLHQPPGGIDHGPFRSAIQARLDCLAYRHARRLVVASEALAAELEREGVSRERMLVVPPGRDVAEAAGVPIDDARQGRRAAFLCVANWIERKGILDLLEAFAHLPPGMATLHLAGDVNADPRYAARVWARLRQPDLAGRVVVHGPVPRETVAALYGAVDAFVLPSVREPYGTVYGEAMSAGLPVVGWRAGNLPHLANDGVEGVLVEPGDVLGLARALETLANDEELRCALGRAAARRALQWPTWEESAALFFTAIREVVDEDSPP